MNLNKIFIYLSLGTVALSTALPTPASASSSIINDLFKKAEEEKTEPVAEFDVNLPQVSGDSSTKGISLSSTDSPNDSPVNSSTLNAFMKQMTDLDDSNTQSASMWVKFNQSLLSQSGGDINNPNTDSNQLEIPEPGSISLLSLAVLGLGLAKSKKN